MSIFNLVSKLLPRIDRATVAEDLRITEKEFTTIVIPSWDAAVEYFKLNKPESRKVEQLVAAFYENFDAGQNRGRNMFADIQRSLPKLVALVGQLDASLDDELEKDIITSGLTVRKTFILRAVGNLSMISRFIPNLLNYIYTAEAEEHNHKLPNELTISKGDMVDVEKNFPIFVRMVARYAMDTKDFQKILDGAPAVYVNKDSEGVVSGLHEGKQIDPFERFGMSGFIGNPIYRLRMVIAKWQNDRYEAAKAKKQQLELRLLYLQMQKDNQDDPAVTKEIYYLQERIEGYDRHLRDVEAI